MSAAEQRQPMTVAGLEGAVCDLVRMAKIAHDLAIETIDAPGTRATPAFFERADLAAFASTQTLAMAETLKERYYAAIEGRPADK